MSFLRLGSRLPVPSRGLARCSNLRREDGAGRSWRAGAGLTSAALGGSSSERASAGCMAVLMGMSCPEHRQSQVRGPLAHPSEGSSLRRRPDS